MKIIIAHPGKQHAYRLIKCLTELGHEVTFCTAIGFNKKNFLIKIFWTLLSKRLVDVPKIKIKHWPLLELFRKTVGVLLGNRKTYIQYYFERIFDRKVANWLKKQEYDIFIGYEVSSLYSFEVVKSHHRVSILDLAQIHFEEIEKLSRQYDALSHLSTRISSLRKKINAIKLAEQKKCNHIFSISNFVQASLLANGIPQKKISLVRIGTCLPTEISSIKNDNCTVLYVGTLRRQKGTDLLIEAIKDLRENFKLSINLVLIGNIIEKELIPHIKQNNFITHFDFMPHSELGAYYSSSDIFCMPSLLDSWGMVVLEAMSFGLPVIVTDNTGAKEVVMEGGGLIVKAGNKNDVRNAIRSLCIDKKLRHRIGEKSSEISKKYSYNLYKNEIRNGLIEALEHVNKVMKK